MSDNNINSIRVLTIAILAATSACTGTDVGNGVVDVDLTLINSAEQSSARYLGEPPPFTNIDSAWVSIERIRLRPASDCEGGAETEFVGPFAVNLLSAEPTESLVGLEVELTNYCRFELRWDSYEPGSITGAPAQLEGMSFVLTGQSVDGDNFVIRSDRGDELRLDARDEGFAIDQDESALLLAFELQSLLEGVEFSAAEVSPDETIRIEPGSNEDLLDVFDDNLSAAASLFRDTNEDGQLDLDETESSDVLAD